MSVVEQLSERLRCVTADPSWSERALLVFRPTPFAEPASAGVVAPSVWQTAC
ncbi:hypothetical protein [Synechococcus sp. M16CYN]|uniref:hypothetical protein n=1 Tax=Synechococcus sp. M16CYN TaxID=3103139 RepID=UPI00333F3877